MYEENREANLSDSPSTPPRRSVSGAAVPSNLHSKGDGGQRPLGIAAIKTGSPKRSGARVIGWMTLAGTIAMVTETSPLREPGRRRLAATSVPDDHPPGG
jgi:hypothetical protein